ncbi:hypothetical protein CKM354_000723100 [Cercospora kikuchii]|uniref:Uncharacterized protein n=1 Tax=Cercospora kikuchii TaxID=84275 RepID=A0A9P3CIU2_9PEZI|nr:uncharacterized protein CKM354_000723100 [Cercospora kikuchii]GIZ44022.1 hypothetical protein CKM354_000723100 [Cercospora kikuchii]
MAEYDTIIGVLLILIFVASLIQFYFEAHHAGLWPDLAASTQHLFETMADLRSTSPWCKEQTADGRHDPADLEQQPARRKSQHPMEYEARHATMWSIRNCRLSFITWGSIAMLLFWTVTSILSARQMHPFVLETHSVHKALDPDIAGDGILIGLFIPAILTIVSLVFGHFHIRDGAVKEIAMAHFANLASLLINTFKAEICGSLGKLAREERLIAAISIDICCTGLRMSFSDKTVLASRIFMTLCSASRLLGLICMVNLLRSIASSAGPQSTSSLYWYGSIGPYEGPSWSQWVLLAIRAVSLVSDTLFFTFKHAFEFDKAQKGQSRLSLHLFSTVRATGLLKYVENIPMLLMDVMAVVALTKNSSRGSLADWGQSAALATALTSAAHWAHRTVYGNIVKSGDEHRWRKLSLPSLELLDAPLNDTGYWLRKREIESKQKLQEQLIEAYRLNDYPLFDDTMEQLGYADVNFGGKDNMTPLLLAISSGNLEMVKRLKIFHQVSTAYAGTTPAVVHAAELGQDQIVDYLLTESPAPGDFSCTSRDGASPLQIACQRGHVDVVKVLLRHAYFSTELMTTTTREPLWSALTYPTLQGSAEMLKLLLASIDQKNDSRIIFSFLVWLIQDGELTAIRRFKDATTERRLPMDQKDSSGWTLLHWAVRQGHLGILQEVLTQTEVTILNDLTNEGKTALHVAAQRGHLDIALRLLDLSGVETTILDCNGRSVLSLAAESGMLELVRALPKPMERGVEEPFVDDDGRTPLSYAAERLHFQIMDLLLETGADPYIMDYLHMLPMAYAHKAISERHPASQSSSWPSYITRLGRQPPSNIATHDIAEVEWRNLERFADRWMCTKNSGDIERWKNALQNIVRHGLPCKPMAQFIAWLCQSAILDPTTKTLSKGYDTQTQSLLPGCLLYFVAEHQLRGLAFLFNWSTWSFGEADMTYLDEIASDCVGVYAAKAIELGYVHHAKFLVEDLNMDVDSHQGIFLHAAVHGERIDGVAWLLSKRPNLELGTRMTALAYNAGKRANKAKTAISTLLLEQGARVSPGFGKLPLFRAAEVHDLEEVIRLLNRDSRTDPCNDRYDGYSALGVALHRVEKSNYKACQDTMQLLMERGARFTREDRRSLPLDACHLVLYGAKKSFLQGLIKSHAYIRTVDPNSYVLGRFAEHGVALLPTTQDSNWDPDTEVSWQAARRMSQVNIANAEESIRRWKHAKSSGVTEYKMKASGEQLAHSDAMAELQLIAVATPLPSPEDDGLAVRLDDNVLGGSALVAEAEVARWPPDPDGYMQPT